MQRAGGFSFLRFHYLCSMYVRFCIFVFLIFPFCLSGQIADVSGLSMIIMDEEVKGQFEFWQDQKQKKTDFSAWRILVVGLRDRRSLNRAIERFKASFPELNYDWEYDRPLYKLKTGVYLDRLDLKPLLYEIRHEFPSALEIKDRMSYEQYFKLRP